MPTCFDLVSLLDLLFVCYFVTTLGCVFCLLEIVCCLSLFSCVCLSYGCVYCLFAASGCVLLLRWLWLALQFLFVIQWFAT